MTSVHAYFKPLRRKLGVMTLLMVFATEMVSLRSRAVADQVTFRIGDYGCCWQISNDEWISLARIDSNAPTFPDSRFTYSRFIPKQHERRGGPFSGINHSWDLHLLQHISIPCGPVLTVMLALAAWLLLSRPRVKNFEPVTPTSEADLLNSRL